MKKPHSGFTLIEMLTVIAVITILAAILIPVLSGVRAKARTTEGASNLRNIVAALNLFQNENAQYPGAWHRYPDTHPTLAGQRHDWKNAIAPYLGLETANQAQIFSCPNVEESFRGPWSGQYPSSYSCNQALVTTDSPDGERPLNIPRPSGVILVMDASTGNNGIADGNLYGIGGVDTIESRPPEQSIIISNYASSPRGTPRFRQAGGTDSEPGFANAAFVDGHVELIQYGDLKYKHFAISY